MPSPAGAPKLEPPPPLARLHIWQIQAVRDVLLVGAIFALVWAGYAMRAVTVPLLIALALAYLFEPLVARLTSDQRITRPMAVGGILLTLGSVTVLVLAIMVPLLIGQSLQFVEHVREGRLQAPLLRVREYVPEKYRDEFERAIEWLGPERTAELKAASQKPAVEVIPARPLAPAAIPDALDEARIREIVREEVALEGASAGGAAPAASSVWLSLVRSGGRAALTLLAAVAQLGLLVFLIPFYFFFFSVWYPSVVSFGRDMIPATNRSRAQTLLSKMDHAIAGFVRGRIVISAIVAALFAIGWAICGVPYAIALGLLIGLFNIVPFLAVVGLPLAVGLMWFKQINLPVEEQWGWFAIIAWPASVYFVVQALDNYVLTPVIAGKATNLDPVTILVAVLAGGSVGGVYGMLLAIPAAACAKILVTDVLLPRIKAWTQGKVSDPLPFDGGS